MQSERQRKNAEVQEPHSVRPPSLRYFFSLMSTSLAVTSACEQPDAFVSKLITGHADRSSLLRINVGCLLNALAFSSDGDYLVNGTTAGVQVWRIEDGKQMATIAASYVRCIAVSKDGKWIAAGTYFGEVFLCDAATPYNKVLALEGISDIYDVNFSPDSSRLVTASANSTAFIWDVAARVHVTALHHDDMLVAKYSPHGDRLATANHESVRIYDSDGYRLLVDIPINVSFGFLWLEAYLFVSSDNKIKQIEASTGSEVSEWLVPGTNGSGRIALPTHGEFMAYSRDCTITFWDPWTHTQLGLIQHTQDVSSIAVSPDGRFLAIGEECGKVTIKRLSHITVSFVFLSCGVSKQI